MTNQDLIDLLKSNLSLHDVVVKSEGSHYNIIAIDDRFDDMSRVQKQQLIYGPLNDKIADGTIHAISIKTFSVAQWQREKMFN